MKKNQFDINKLTCVVGRGGPLKPISSGVYKVNQNMLDDLIYRPRANHASILGCLLADKIAKSLNLSCFTVDPVSVDEFDDVARLSGTPLIVRESLSHALNIKATARKVAAKLKKKGKYSDFNMIIAHLGGGISVTAHRRGKMVDVNNAIENGPFSPERSGTLPIMQLIDLCYSGKYEKDKLKGFLLKDSGLKGYLGTNDARIVQKNLEKGDGKSKLVMDAMIYQIAKEIGAMAAVLNFDVDCIVLTGNMAYSKYIVGGIRKRVRRIARFIVMPGQNELESLAYGALRVLRGEEMAKEY